MAHRTRAAADAKNARIKIKVSGARLSQGLGDLFQGATQSNLALLLSLRHDFPTEWSAFVHGTSDFAATIRKDFFPYFTQGKQITITGLELYDGDNVTKHHLVGDQVAWDAATTDLGDKDKQAFSFTAGEDPAGPTQVLTRTADAQVFLIIRYSLS